MLAQMKYKTQLTAPICIDKACEDLLQQGYEPIQFMEYGAAMVKSVKTLTQVMIVARKTGEVIEEVPIFVVPTPSPLP